MPKFVLDTNVYIASFRDAAKAAELKEFLAAFLSITYVSAVVVQELRAGARSRAQLDALRDVVAPFEQRGRVLTPSYEAFVDVGRILAEMAAKEGLDIAGMKASFLNDLLLAASCRRAGATLITNNARDFARIARHLGGFGYLAPWPAVAGARR